jgi:hypothetical protein
VSLLTRVESILEGIVEGSFRRVFSPRLQPVEIARALERVMLDHRLVGANAVEVPNLYTARLNPTDFAQFDSMRDAVQHEAVVHLNRRAAEEGCRPIAPIQVEIVSDPVVTRSFVRGEARFEEQRPDVNEELGKTRRFESLAAAGTSTLVLRTEDGLELTLDGRGARIGRGVDNDLVVKDVRVSRHHAIIEPDGDGWMIRDAGSMNGTYLDGERVELGRFSSAADISLGGYRITVSPT